MIPEKISAPDAYHIGLIDKVEDEREVYEQIVEDEEAMKQYEKEWRKSVKQDYEKELMNRAAAPGATKLVCDLIDAIDGKSSEQDVVLSC